MLINYYLSECNSEEHQLLLNGGYYIRFILHQEAIYLPLYCYGYERDIKTCIPQHQLGLNACPPDYLPCEINTLYLGHFVFIKKSNWINKQPITLYDIILGD